LLKSYLLCEEASLIAPLKASPVTLLKQSAEGANYVSQGQVPALQGTSPLVEFYKILGALKERTRSGPTLPTPAIERHFEVQLSMSDPESS
jgi:hypothetical protein